MREENVPPERLVAQLAARQHGVVTAEQLYALGIDKSAITRRLMRGYLHRLHRGVYAVGHPSLGWEGRFKAAVMACGAEAALSHRSAAMHLGLLPHRAGPVDVSVPWSTGGRRRGGIRMHRSRSLSPNLIVQRARIPVTIPARTLRDLKRVVPEWQWRKAVRQAEFKGLDVGPAIVTDRTRSDLERDFLRLCRRHGFPAPEVNVKVGRWTVDFLWRKEKVAVETDFYEYHRGKIAFQDDHSRDLDLRRQGLNVHRFSEEQVNERPAEVVADLRHALSTTREHRSRD
jgi:very-short-patch-repair endonuclease